MKKKKSKVFATFLSFLCLFSLLSTSAFAAQDNGSVQTAETYELYIGDTRITSQNASDVFGDGSVSYDADTYTLTLHNAAISSAIEYRTDCVASIYATNDLHIQQTGSNNITAPDAAISSIGIYVKGNLTISGEGQLTVNGGTVNGSNASIESEYVESQGIYTKNYLTITEATITANGSDAIASDQTYAYSNGIATYGGMYVDENSTLNCSSNTARALYAYSQAIALEGSDCLNINSSVVTATAGNAISVSGSSDKGRAFSTGIYTLSDLLIDFNGYVEASSSTAQGANAFSFGVQTYGAAIAVYNGYLTADGNTATSEDGYAGSAGISLYLGGLHLYENDAHVYLKGGHAKAPFAHSNGVYITGGDFSLLAGNATITGGSYDSDNGDGFGIYVEQARDADNDLIGGSVNLQCTDITLNSYGYGFLGTTLQVSAPSGYAIYAESGIEYDPSLTISTPSNGVVAGQGSFDNIFYEWDSYTITDTNGTIASDVTIEPLLYKINICGLSFEQTILVPAGYSANDIYCEKYGVDDLSEGLNTKKDGYTFCGWYTDESCTPGNEFTFDTIMNENITIYAKWIPISETDSIPISPGIDTSTQTPLSPKTADNYSILWIGVLAIAGIAITSIKRKSLRAK